MTYPTRTHAITSTQKQILEAETSLAFVPEAVQTTQGVFAPSFSSAINFGVGTNPASLDIGDFNGDGWLDLVTVNSSSADVSVLLNNGTGGFHPATNFSVGNSTSPRFLAVGDFNGDGFSDLVTANYPVDFSILLNNGTGGFNSAIGINGGGKPTLLGAGDFNGDGLSDLVTASYVSYSVSVLLNNGTGGFNPPTSFGAGYLPNAVALGDFNKDGWLDLATANILSDNVSVLLNNGTGGFNPATNFAVGSFPTSLAAGDFNNDGWLDLVAANFSSHNVSVLLNDGTGSFHPATNFDVGGNISSVAVADLNGDGKLDLVTGNTTALNVLLGNGTGGFNNGTNLELGTRPGSIIVRDFNGDGKPDIATSNYDSKSVSVLFNTTNFPPVAKADSATTNEDTAVIINVLTNDTDPENDLLNITSVNTTGTIGTVINNGNTLTYNPGDAFQYLAAGQTATTNFSYTISDTNGSTSSANVGVTITGVNDAPINTVPGAQLDKKNTPLVFSAANGNQISVNDVDAGSNSEKVTLCATNGTLTLNGVTGLSFINGDGTNDGIITFTGTLGNINNALNGLQFNPNANYTGAASLTITTNDQDNTSAAGGLSDTDKIAITVAILGTSGNDTMLGTNRNDTIYGLAGNDTIFGKQGVNTIDGGDGDDIIFGGTKADIIHGGNGNDRIIASDGNNTVFGDAGNDSIYSGTGNDFINGGTGNDKIWLGGGLDQVVIAKGNGVDTIYNFQLGQTRIALADGLQFSDLTITQGQDGALIKVGNELLTALSLVSASSINSSSFVSV